MAAPPDGVRGVVTDQATGSPVAGIRVFLLHLDGSSAAPSVYTDGSGAYVIPSVADGAYYLRYVDVDGAPFYRRTFLGGSSTMVGSTQLVVAGGAATADQALDATGYVRGTVVDAASSPVAGIRVIAVEVGTGAAVGSTMTHADGSYKLDSVAPGSYKLRFVDADPTPPDYAVVYSGGKASLSTATVVDVVSDGTTTADVMVGTGTTLSGQILSCSDTPISGAKVTLFAGNWAGYPNTAGAVRSTTTLGDGSFSFEGLPTLGGFDEYTIKVVAAGYDPEFYDDSLRVISDAFVFEGGIMRLGAC